jgi:hypothetical protein
VSRAADLEEDAIAPFELHLLVVKVTRQKDRAVDVHELIRAQPAVSVICNHRVLP